MDQLAGYICAGAAIIAYWSAGVLVVRDMRWTTLIGLLLLGSVLTGAAVGLLDPAEPVPLAFIPLATLAGMSLTLALSLDAPEPDGDEHGS